MKPLLLLAVRPPALAQDPQSWLANLPQAKDYVQKRVSSYNTAVPMPTIASSWEARPPRCSTSMGPASSLRIWVTIASGDPQHLKAPCCALTGMVSPRPALKLRSGISSGLGWANISAPASRSA